MTRNDQKRARRAIREKLEKEIGSLRFENGILKTLNAKLRERLMERRESQMRHTTRWFLYGVLTQTAVVIVIIQFIN